jgi:hypothetical protein
MAELLTQDTVEQWPPQRGHPLIEAVLATNYEVLFFYFMIEAVCFFHRGRAGD